MRLFPRATRVRLAAATLALTTCVGVLALPQAFANDRQDTLKSRKHHASKVVDSAKRDLDEASGSLRAALRHRDAAKSELMRAVHSLAAAKAKLTIAQAEDHQAQAALDTARARLSQARTDLDDGQQRLEAQQVVVTNTVTSIYEQGDPRLLSFAAMLQAGSTADLTRQSEANQIIIGNQTRAFDDLQAAEVLLQVREEQVQQAKDAVAVQRAAAAKNLDRTTRLHDRARAAQIQVRAMLDSRRQAAQRARQIKQRDRRILEHAKHREQRIQAKLLAAARRAALRDARRGSGYAGRSSGFLMRPVSGPVTSPYGYRIHPIYGYWGLHDGTDFAVACGEGLWAAADGKVVSEYYSSVYGNRLYLNVGTVNGKNVTVVYNHMSGYKARVGDVVRRGQVVGYVGDTGWSTGCHLHFTVLVDGTAVDPMKWF